MVAVGVGEGMWVGWDVKIRGEEGDGRIIYGYGSGISEQVGKRLALRGVPKIWI